jgi:phenylacetate-CoA ligase
MMGSKFFSIFAAFEEQAAWLRRLEPVCLYTLPSNLEALLTVFESRGTGLPSLRHIFTGGEMLEGYLRERTRKILGVGISDNHGSTEAFVAWECPEGSYHINAEHVLVEVVDPQGRPARAGESGRILVTTLENYLMPLVRYEIGDLACPAIESACPCGRTLPLLGRVAGRTIDLFGLGDGRLISPWALVVRLKTMPELKQFQIVQKTVERCLLRFVSDSELEAEAREWVRRVFCEVLGPGAQLELERVDEIKRSSGGKYATAISELQSQGRSAG